MQAINVVHAQALQIPTHLEQENNFIKGELAFHVLLPCLFILILTATRTLVVLNIGLMLVSIMTYLAFVDI